MNEVHNIPLSLMRQRSLAVVPAITSVVQLRDNVNVCGNLVVGSLLCVGQKELTHIEYSINRTISSGTFLPTDAKGDDTPSIGQNDTRYGTIKLKPAA